MSFNHVKIYYGPCRSLNDVIYRPRKLKGIRVALQKHGYRVDFVPVQWRDYCMVEICGHEVFRCNVQNLKFNTCIERDEVAKRMVNAVLEGTERCLQARSYLWSRELINEHLTLYLHTNLAPVAYFADMPNLEPLDNWKRQLETILEISSTSQDSDVGSTGSNGDSDHDSVESDLSQKEESK